MYSIFYSSSTIYLWLISLTASKELPILLLKLLKYIEQSVLVNCISDLPICEVTSTANVPNSAIALGLLANTHSILLITEFTFHADKDCTVKTSTNKYGNSINRNVSSP